MVNTIKGKIKYLIKKIELSKINYLNHKFKKYIIKFEEDKEKIKIFNSTGDYKIVDNNVANKVKIMEIIKDHQKEIEEKINYYDKHKDDNILVLLSSSLLLLIIGCVFIFSFFIGSYTFLLLSLLSFTITNTLFTINTYKFILSREEVKRLKLIKENKDILNDNEIKDIIIDSYTMIKNQFYNIIIKTIDLFENKRVKS